MVKLVSTLGTTPGGVFEAYRHVERENAKIEKVVVLATQEQAVQFAASLVRKIFGCMAPNLPVEVVNLPVVDIDSKESLDKVMNIVAGLIQPGDYVDFTGGRKALSVAIALKARELKAHTMTTQIPSDAYRAITDTLAKLREKKEVTCEDVANLVVPTANSFTID